MNTHPLTTPVTPYPPIGGEGDNYRFRSMSQIDATVCQSETTETYRCLDGTHLIEESVLTDADIGPFFKEGSSLSAFRKF